MGRYLEAICIEILNFYEVTTKLTLGGILNLSQIYQSVKDQETGRIEHGVVHMDLRADQTKFTESVEPPLHMNIICDELRRNA